MASGLLIGWLIVWLLTGLLNAKTLDKLWRIYDKHFVSLPLREGLLVGFLVGFWLGLAGFLAGFGWLFGAWTLFFCF